MCRRPSARHPYSPPGTRCCREFPANHRLNHQNYRPCCTPDISVTFDARAHVVFPFLSTQLSRISSLFHHPRPGYRPRPCERPRGGPDPTRTFDWLETTRVRSAERMQKRMTFHMGSTKPAHVYCGMYCGMWVWYDTRIGILKILAYSSAPKTRVPAKEQRGWILGPDLGICAVVVRVYCSGGQM